MPSCLSTGAMAFLLPSAHGFGVSGGSSVPHAIGAPRHHRTVRRTGFLRLSGAARPDQYQNLAITLTPRSALR